MTSKVGDKFTDFSTGGVTYDGDRAKKVSFHGSSDAKVTLNGKAFVEGESFEVKDGDVIDVSDLLDKLSNGEIKRFTIG